MKRFLLDQAYMTWLFLLSLLVIPYAYDSWLISNGVTPDLNTLVRVCFVPKDLTNGIHNLDFNAVLHGVGTLFTYQVFHANSQHLYGNLVPLFLFGLRVEKKLGSGFFMFALLATGVAGALFHWWLSPYGPNPVLGASGAIGGLFGIFTILYASRRLAWDNWNLLLMAVIFITFLLPNMLSFLDKLELKETAVNLHLGSYASGLLIGLLHTIFQSTGKEKCAPQ